MDIVARFEIPYYQILNEKSKLVSDLPHFATDVNHLIRLYRLMVLNRIFDTKAIALQRTGKMGTYPSTCGQEALFVGVGDAMEKEDILVPYYRDVADLFQRGVKLEEILLYWGGDERGNNFQSNTRDFPISVPIGTQVLHAAGAATALNIQGKKGAVLTLCGEGGTSEGDFYEAMNVAGIWKLPLVFVVNNNQWAISVSRKAQTASETIAQKAIAAGFSGEQVDGNDVIAVRERVFLALQKAREKKEPTLIECITYRHCDHTTADDASRYELKSDRESEWTKEPIQRLKKYLDENNVWSQEKEKNLIDECNQLVEESVQAYLNMPSPSTEEMMDYLYETLPRAYEEERHKIKMKGMQHG